MRPVAIKLLGVDSTRYKNAGASNYLKLFELGSSTSQRGVIVVGNTSSAAGFVCVVFSIGTTAYVSKLSGNTNLIGFYKDSEFVYVRGTAGTVSKGIHAIPITNGLQLIMEVIPSAQIGDVTAVTIS